MMDDQFDPARNARFLIRMVCSHLEHGVSSAELERMSRINACAQKILVQSDAAELMNAPLLTYFVGKPVLLPCLGLPAASDD